MKRHVKAARQAVTHTARKATVAAVIAGAGTLALALQDGLTLGEVGGVVAAMAAAAGAVYKTSNKAAT